MSATLVQVIVGGLLLGAVYALFSSGLTLIWGMMNVVNFAHGDFVMLGMYSAVMVWTALGGGPFASVPIAAPRLSAAWTNWVEAVADAATAALRTNRRAVPRRRGLRPWVDEPNRVCMAPVLVNIRRSGRMTSNSSARIECGGRTRHVPAGA